MLLAIDVGNTNTVFAVFADGEVAGTWRLSTESKRTADEYALSLKQLMVTKNILFDDISDVIISCVVPETLFAFKSLCSNYFSQDIIVVGEDSTYLPIKVKLDKPSEIGADRLVNTVAASKKYNGAMIIIDFGTATTFDVVTEEGEYLGGSIAPGVDLSLDALHLAAAKLPKIAIEKPQKVIGTNTITAMQSGVYWGYIGLIEGMVGKIKEEYGKDMTVIATGGLAPLYANATDVIEYLESDLTIEGLKIIFDLNQNKVTNIKEATS
jgi:type III pantothenate kinase